MTQQPPIPMRMSGAGACPRRNNYRSLGFAESNPANLQGRNRMNLGNAAELLIINAMQDEGWEVQHTAALDGWMVMQDSDEEGWKLAHIATGGSKQLEVTLDYPPMTGHPDGICRHPTETKNLWVTLECKSMNPGRLQLVEYQGLEPVYPQYLSQAACYSQALYDLKLVAHPRRTVFGQIDREGRYIQPQRVAWTEEYYVSLTNQLAKTWETALSGRLSERPFTFDSKTCSECPYFDICHPTSELPSRHYENPVELHDAELLETARQFAAAKSIVEQTTKLLRSASTAINDREFIAGDVRCGFFFPDDGPEYDDSALRRFLTPEQIRLCRKPRAPAPRFWPRVSRRP